MQLDLPVYIESYRDESTKELIYRCRPLFAAHPTSQDADLQRAIRRLQRRWRGELEALGKHLRHEGLLTATFQPAYASRKLKLTLELKNRFARCRFLFVTLKQLGRQIAFTPAIPELWFEVVDVESLEARATEVLSTYFRRLAKEGNTTLPEELSLPGDAWVESVQVELQLRQMSVKSGNDPFARLGEEQEMDGREELERVGRSLDALYPDLARTIARDQQVRQLADMTRGSDRRPVMIVGSHLVGKTALIHELVFRRQATRKQKKNNRGNVWLLSPQRLISGMAYVGQWEHRLIAILREAKRRKHILYFDEFLGLYEAGKSRDSDLCAADVLRTWIGRRDVRVLAEMTPEAWQRFQERDRGLADQFQVLRLDEADDDETLAVLIELRKSLEQKFDCCFHTKAIPTIIKLHRRFARDSKFPGKAAKFMNQLAAKYQGTTIDEQLIQEEFMTLCGLSRILLEDSQQLRRKSIMDSLTCHVVGQPDALEAFADTISVAKARLNDPNRPLATNILLGPTGVGKTQSAKALAHYLFRSEERLIRFDMNEFVSAEAVATLTGTPYRPNGLLTSAVRRQPYCVLLFDEIEKAHPDAYDLLLQVIGEARLTDANGRTTDFSGAIILMTSNLGVQESQTTVGFNACANEQSFLRAAEKFFRPEFLNRIDRVIPFAPLDRSAITKVAQIQIGEVFRREGLVRRQCILHVDQGALDRVVDRGFDPKLGARALKREIERQLTRPIANRLSTVKPDVPMVAGLYPSGPGLAVHLQPIIDAPRHAEPEPRSCDSMQWVETANRLADSATAAVGGQSMSFEVGRVSDKQYRYFAVREQIVVVRELAQVVRDAFEVQLRQTARPEIRTNAPNYNMRRFNCVWEGKSDVRIVKEIAASQDIDDYFREVVKQSLPISHRAGTLHELRDQCALLNMMLERLDDAESDDIVLMIRSVSPKASDILSHASVVQGIGEAYLSEQRDLRVVQSPEFTYADELDRQTFVPVSGPFARLFATAEQGTHLICYTNGALVPIQLKVLNRTRDQSVQSVIETARQRQRQWLRQLSAGSASVDQDPFPLDPVLRVYKIGISTIDLRTGLSVDRIANGADLQRFSLRHLALANRFPFAEPSS